MKKFIVIFSLLVISLSVSAQKLYVHVPNDLFSGDKALGTSTWLWQFTTVVTGEEFVWDKAEKKLLASQPLNSMGPAVGYRHYRQLSDGTAFNDIGINVAALIGADINNTQSGSVKIALLANVFQYVNFGCAYTINQPNHWGLILGGSIKF